MNVDPDLAYPELAGESREAELLAAWRAAHAAWQANVFDREKAEAERRTSAALRAERLHLRAVSTGEPNRRETQYADETGERDPDPEF